MKRVLAGLLLAVPCLVQAADSHHTGNSGRWFVGAGFGSVGFDDDGFSDDLEDELRFITGDRYDVDTETDDTALLLKAGYRFNRIVGVEVSYIDYGDVVYEINGDEAFTFGIAAISLAANVGYTFNSGWRPFAIVGLSSVDVDADDSDRYLGFHYGFGGEFTPQNMSALTFRIAYEGDIFVDDSLEDESGFDLYAMDIGTLNIGATFNF
ncbi:outer membrane beta-barrel protein [Pseudomaricurvus sp. HS19]|uniref:outer membrane beta-barrel protein n=1 Tax=Pseudomaricurvus sp. HS19 TaxID=2692626 RepID=UPI0013698674|nr:outer membrane beta-barrel protein [Pseudomaricurvus sp. HS19]MYM63328.1 outer membrane beta-barrel protein [Pseudomaricurvus sp. HS19]